jgi:nucleoside-diphosphate-sugar epimerase
MTQRILITGAAGGVASLLRPRLAREGRLLRLLDLAAVPDPQPGEEPVLADLTDLDAMRAACQDIDVLVHLGGLSREDTWERVLQVNINGTYTIFEAARRAGVPRVILASSNHAVGFHPADRHAEDYLFPRPDTYYGVSKVAGEALGSLYHDRYGLDVVCLRVGGCYAEPRNPRMLATWLSPDDAARLIEAAIAVRSPGFRVVWGVSDNTRRRWSLAEARALGYQPRDNAEDHASSALAQPSGPFDQKYLGGEFCSPDLDAATET